MTHNFKQATWLIILLLLIGTIPLQGRELPSSIARIVKMRGAVELFTHKSKKGTGPPPHILYDGYYYSLKKAKLGQRVKPGEIIRTGKKSQVRLVFNNGDQYTLGPGTVYQGEANQLEQKKGEGSVVNLLYGKFRAVISKQGPRKELVIKTRNAALGVRGTDLFVSKRGLSGRTKLTVIRGIVAAKSFTPKEDRPKPEADVVLSKQAVKSEVVSAGFSAYVDSLLTISKPAQDPSADKSVIDKLVTLFRTDKRELVKIQKASKIKMKIAALRELPPQKRKQIKQLVRKAVKNTLDDIKNSDPALFEKIKKQKKRITLEALTTKVVHQSFKSAPAKVDKPSESDLDDERIDAYEKYFEE